MPFSLIPDMIFPALTDITPELLQSRGICWLLLDFDNTIVPYTVNEPTEKMCRWFDTMKKSGISLCIVSNTKKPRVMEFAKKYDLLVINRAKKPFQKGINEAKRRFSLDSRKTALVGDQIYTDTLGANCGGLTSILVGAIHNHNIWLKLRHVAELPFIAIGKRRIDREKRRKI